MKVYGRVSDHDRLLAAERDPVTGRRELGRDDKGDRSRTRPKRPRSLVTAAAVVAAVVVAAIVVVALVGGGDDGADQQTATTSPPGDRTTSARTGEGASTETTELVASAISLSYTGGTLETATCSSAAANTCEVEPFGWDPLAVRCTADGCSVTLLGVTFTLDGTTPVAIDVPYEGPECGTAPVTGTLVPVGSATTRGVTHPARITGTVQVSIAARLVPTADCIGVEQVYVYDAVPG
jgi:hypothetical protein